MVDCEFANVSAFLLIMENIRTIFYLSGFSFDDLIMKTTIPFDEFSETGNPLHFSHANGYPPLAYQPLFGHLKEYFHIYASRMRPLWPGSNPNSISNWKPFSTDLLRFLEEKNLFGIVGAGHSIGGTTTLRSALNEPDRFSLLMLIDPVIFQPSTILLWRFISWLGIGKHIHPWVKGASKRRVKFDSRTSMYTNYRNKPIFSGINDENLTAYVSSIAEPMMDGSIKLSYPPAWEAQIYLTGMNDGLDIWNCFSQLQFPILIIRGDKSDTFSERTAEILKKRLPALKIRTIANATHLVPLEKPGEVANLMIEFFQKSTRDCES